MVNMKNYILFWTSLLLVGFVGASHKFPSGLTNCHLSDPALDQCLVKAIEQAFQFISSKGIPSINLAAIDPLQITKIKIGEGASAVALVQNYHNITIHGFSNQKLTKAHLDLDKKVLHFESISPMAEQKAKYDINGKILVLPVVGTGECDIKLMDVALSHTLTFKEETRGGKRYFKVKKYDLKIEPNGVHFQFDNLFDGDKVLGDNINAVVNDNWKEIFYDVKPGIESAYGVVCHNLANHVFDNVPVDEIFLP